MYAQYFGLKKAPFSIAPDPRYLFMSERHREALAHLLYGVGSGGGFVVLTGEIGAGKTTVCRSFLEQIPRRSNVAYIFNPKMTVAELLKSVCEEFRIPYEHPDSGKATIKDYVDPLNDFLLKTHAVGQNNVLIIDEAQNLCADVLEQLRLLTNLETSERKLLQIMLIGQPELRTMLAQPELEQLAQRVIAHYHLDVLTENETGQYIQHRLSISGLQRGSLFDRRAVHRIHQLTNGVPRRVNLLCDRALLGAYVENKNKVDQRIVDQAAREVCAIKAAANNNPATNTNRYTKPQHGPWMTWLAGGLLLSAIAGIGLVSWLHQHNQDVKLPSKGSASSAKGAYQAHAVAPAASSAPQRMGTISRALAAPLIGAHMVYQSAFRKEKDALRALAPMWQITLGDDGDVCTQAQKQSLACFRNSSGMTLIRQLERPVVLALRDDHNHAIYALLTGLRDQTALLQFDGHTYALPLSVLSNMWRGDFATLWRTPPTFRMKVLPGNTGVVVDWLAVQLSKIDQSAAPQGKQIFDASMQSRVYAFQMAQGLKPDGVVGATTFMQINRAVGIEEPRLLNSQTTARRNDVLHP